MKSFLLLIIAILLFVIIAPIGFLWQCIDRFFKMNEYLYKVAIGIDQLGNIVCSSLLNHTLVKSSGSQFGHEDETISSVLGKNKASNTLTIVGKLISHLLNKIEENHVENAVENINKNKY